MSSFTFIHLTLNKNKIALIVFFFCIVLEYLFENIRRLKFIVKCYTKGYALVLVLEFYQILVAMIICKNQSINFCTCSISEEMNLS